MRDGIGFFLISGFCLWMICFSFYRIMIGTNRIKHPMYDNDAKRKPLFLKGVIGFIVGIVCGGIFITMSIIIILIELK